jgi:scyllo-inositol 2-dehydrogenase (NADP+)
MRVIVAGLGIQGKKRSLVAGPDLVATVDPVNPDAKYKSVLDVPLSDYDAALVCTPDSAKIELLTYLLKNGKHVLVEKPILSDNNAEIVALRDLAKASRTVCYTAYNHRFEPHLVNLKRVMDSGRLGKIHSVKFFYGNGTARDVRNSPWRDKDMGIIPDLGSHMLDTALFLLGKIEDEFEPLKIQCFENKAPDYVLFGSKGTPFILCEASMLSWRNTFLADVVGEKGSAHIHCLCKWGPSTFTVRTRVLPSGRPAEESETIECKDPTWVAEYAHFKSLCASPTSPGANNLDNDIWINQVFKNIWAKGRSKVVR